MKINILGYGQMAKQIAALFYLGGHDITLWNHAGVEEKEFSRHVKLINRTLLSEKQGTFRVVSSLDMLEDNLTIESVIEDVSVKRDLYNALKGTLTRGYFTNSSSYSPSEISPEVGGLHFYNPITMNIIEVYQPESTVSPDLPELVDFLEDIEFTIIPVKGNRGYIGNYILFHEISSALKLMERYGYTAESVSKVYEKLYDGRNIFTIVDLIGVDVVYQILINLKERDDSIYLPDCLHKALSLNILGRKNKTTIRTLF